MSTKKVEELYGTLNERGQLIPDPVPVAPPVSVMRKPSLVEQVQALVRSERLRAEAAAGGYETFAEADDFDVDDDYDPSSPWENDFDPSVAELLQRQAEDEAAAPPDEPNGDPAGDPAAEDGDPGAAA